MRTIVRNTALTLVALAMALILPNTASAACEGFADVPEDTACYESVMYLAEHGITKGTADNAFSPAQPVTVRQWAVMLCRASEWKQAAKHGLSWDRAPQSKPVKRSG